MWMEWCRRDKIFLVMPEAIYSEMLSDERKEGRQEGIQEGRQQERDRLFRLIDLMEANEDADKIPLLRKDAGFLQEMFEKYHIEA